MGGQGEDQLGGSIMGCLSRWIGILALGSIIILDAIGTSRLTGLTTLDVFVIDSKSLVHLGTKSGIVIDPVLRISSCSIRRVTVDTYKLKSSEFSISKSIPVILPASSG